MADTSSDILLNARQISKRFGITQALDDVSVTFCAGEVHALMGENGAGKSTLGKVIAGLHKQDSGSVTIGGRALKPGSIDDAFDAGVRIVHQELAQCPNLSVAENLCLADMPVGKMGLVDRHAMDDRAARLLRDLEPGIDVQAPLGKLSPGHRQIVQIASSLEGHDAGVEGGPRLIVFDEPTSSLSIAEVERLLQIVRQLAAGGLTVVYVSHRMGEIFACCDRVTVLRDGRYVATSVVKEIDESALVEQMIGRKIPKTTRRTATPGGEAAALSALAGKDHEAPRESAGKPLLDVRSIVSPGKLRDVSLAVAPGEILGIGGLVGAGRSELMDAIFGLDHKATGQVLIDGEPLPMRRVRESIGARVGYVPEDRRLQGLFFELGVDENIVMPFMPRLGRFGIRKMRAERDLVAERLKSFQVKTASTSSLPGELSGGNQQKLLIARWMAADARVLLLDEPTRGIDVGTKAEIYRLVRQAADGGAAVLLVSSEMPELLALSDRLVVLCEGRLTGELTGDEMTQANILRLATVEESAAVGV